MDLCINILHSAWDMAHLSKGYSLFKIKLISNSLTAVQCAILLCDKTTKNIILKSSTASHEGLGNLSIKS